MNHRPLELKFGEIESSMGIDISGAWWLWLLILVLMTVAVSFVLMVKSWYESRTSLWEKERQQMLIESNLQTGELREAIQTHHRQVRAIERGEVVEEFDSDAEDDPYTQADNQLYREFDRISGYIDRGQEALERYGLSFRAEGETSDVIEDQLVSELGRTEAKKRAATDINGDIDIPVQGDSTEYIEKGLKKSDIEQLPDANELMCPDCGGTQERYNLVLENGEWIRCANEDFHYSDAQFTGESGA